MRVVNQVFSLIMTLIYESHYNLEKDTPNYLKCGLKLEICMCIAKVVFEVSFKRAGYIVNPER